jgi:hypothetical protein
MVAVLVAVGLGWTETVGNLLHVVRALTAAITLGASVYSVALLVLWSLSGQPKGPEADMLTFAARLVRRLVGRHLGCE